MIIPDGAEKIGSYWFYDSQIESIVISASVKEICANAFCRCEGLKEITFAEGSKLKVIG